MVGKKMIFNAVRASTIVEVIVAMIVMIVVFGIAMMIYTNVVRSSLSLRRLRASSILNSIMAEKERHGAIGDETELVDGMRIEVKVSSWQESESLLNISLQAFDQNQQSLATAHKIILKP